MNHYNELNICVPPPNSFVKLSSTSVAVLGVQAPKGVSKVK